MDLTGWKTPNQETAAVKPSNGSDPLTGEDEGGDSKTEQSSPEKKKVKKQNNTYGRYVQSKLEKIGIINFFKKLLLFKDALN